MRQDRHRAKLDQPEITLSLSTPGFALGISGSGETPPPGDGFRIIQNNSFRLLMDGSKRLYMT